MLLSEGHLCEFEIGAKDGTIGSVHSFLFDDRKWVIRYLVVDTGKWLPGRKVLILPSALGEPSGTERILNTELTLEQIKNSPDIDADKPVSRQRELELHQYYGWVPYWSGFGATATPLPSPRIVTEEADAGQKGDIHLRSTREVKGYAIRAADGGIGSINDFIIDNDTWDIRYLVVDTGGWLSGRKVLIAPLWVDKISWADRRVAVAITKESVEGSPEYNPGAPVNREYEVRLYDYYGRPKYWV